MVEKRKSAGRPTKFNEQVAKTILDYIRMGCYLETAAQTAGIDRITLYEWTCRGERGESPFADFVRELRIAQGESEVRDLRNISQAAENGIWQAAAWKLERRHPERWALTQKFQIMVDKELE